MILVARRSLSKRSKVNVSPKLLIYYLRKRVGKDLEKIKLCYIVCFINVLVQ